MRYDFGRNNGNAKKRIICFIMGLMLVVASVVPAGLNIFANDPDSGYKHMNFEMHPDDEDPDKTVTLDGLMPKNAKVEVVDVTDEVANNEKSNTLDEKTESVTNDVPEAVANDVPEAVTANVLETAEEITSGGTADDKNCSVDNTEIQDATNGDADRETATSTDANIDSETTTESSIDSDTETTADDIISGETTEDDIKTQDSTAGDADRDSIEDKTEDKISDEDDTSNDDINNDTDDADTAEKCETIAAYDITIKVGKKEYQPTEKRPIRVEISDARISTDKTFKLYHITDDGEREEIIDFEVTDGSLSFDATGFSIYEIVAITSGNSVDVLDGKTYGIMNYTTGGTHGYALMADEGVHALIEVVTHETAGNPGTTIFVDEGSEISRWTFHRINNNNYKLSSDGNKYLAVDRDSLTIVDSADDAATFQVTGFNNNRFRLKCNNKYVTFVMNDDGQVADSYFNMSSTTSNNNYLNIVDFAQLEEGDEIIFSAERVSVSDVPNGARVIVYTRIWDDVNTKYDTYAVSHDGSLFKCYASGGKILWLGDGANSLEWEFTEYYDKVTKEPNYYYELYNPYSEKYIAPQMAGNQTLSDNTIGITMPGRRNGEFYSEILAWDFDHMAYVGMKPNEDNTKLVPCAQAVSLPFYFATLEELNLSGTLHKVETINNFDFGITIKMQDFDKRLTMSNFLGENDSDHLSETKNLLSTNLGADGYPVTIIGSNKKSLAELYTNPEMVNGLFIKSIYESSGYFEFDSCQNFATLCNEDQNGTLKDMTEYVDSKGNTVMAREFTVYRELGTSDNSNAATRKHGQFLPYDTIYNKPISTKHKNTYSALTDLDGTKGHLPESDPRKYEKLYNVGNKSDGTKPNYFNGMELSASFVQTVSGLDAWGHDIIFEFTGDDDFWLYVDGELVINLGGIHSALEGNVNFRTGAVYVNGNTTTLKQIFIDNYTERYKAEHDDASPSSEEISKFLLQYFEPDENAAYGCEEIFADYSTHDMRIFYMERGAGASNLHMKFNMTAIAPGNVVVSKTISGDGAEYLDTDFLEYPFQIYYTIPDPDDATKEVERLLGNDDQHIRVTYQNSNQPVTFVSYYKPPGYDDEDAYDNIYFINPAKNAEIAFPDETIKYRIVECMVDHSVYGSVRINGVEIPEDSDRIDKNGNLWSYTSDLVSAEDRPTISFDNVVNDNVIKDLFITKKLVDENGNEILDDPTTFSFRLYLSSVDVDPDDMTLVNMYKYYVLKKVGSNWHICKYDPATQKFVDTSLEYTKEMVDKLKKGEIEGYDLNDLTYVTSGFGAISGIPSGYTICVPGLPVGSVFKVTEDVKSGYGLKEYNRVDGVKIVEGETQLIPSYKYYVGEQMKNIGKVIAAENPQLEAINMEGYGYTVKKQWSDLDITTSHDPIYMAVYVDGELLEGSVKKLVSPETSVYYFWPSLKRNIDGTTRTDLSGYEVREVIVAGDNITVDSEGTVSGYDSIEPLEAGDKINLNAVRTKTATPEGEDPGKEFEYMVSYSQGIEDSSGRTDTITNTRTGGISVRLFKWNSTTPLSGGKFTLTDETGTVIDKYTSDSDGLVTVLYNFERNKIYTLTETVAPDGYVGLQKKLNFKVNDDDSVSLLYDDDGETAWGDSDEDDKKWANWKQGTNGITAFIDVYNKPFNLKISKIDSVNSEIKLGASHFALYKQAYTSVGGAMRNVNPMSGFEDLVTVNGEVDICGGNSGRTIKPGDKGSVYYLSETQAPPNYTMLDEDIVFSISPLGVPTIISGLDNSDLIETEDSYTLVLDVQNTKTDPNKNYLIISKTVKGNQGDKNDSFTFTMTIEGDDGNTEYTMIKNEEDPTVIHSGDTFLMKHGDNVTIELPKDITVKVSEENGDYNASYKLNGVAKNGNEVTFEFTEDTGDIMLAFTNTREGIIPTGVETHLSALVIVSIMLIGSMILLIRVRHKRYYEE